MTICEFCVLAFLCCLTTPIQCVVHDERGSIVFRKYYSGSMTAMKKVFQAQWKRSVKILETVSNMIDVKTVFILNEGQWFGSMRHHEKCANNHHGILILSRNIKVL